MGENSYGLCPVMVNGGGGAGAEDPSTSLPAADHFSKLCPSMRENVAAW